MELNILIEGDINRQMVSDSLARRLSKSAPFIIDAEDLPNALAILGRKIAKPDTLQFDGINTPERLADCVVALRDYRLSVPKLVVGVFVCAPGVIVLSNRVPLVIEGRVDEAQEAALREAFESSTGIGRVIVVPEGNEPKIEFLGPGVELGFSMLEKVEDDGRPPLGPALVWEANQEVHEAPTLSLDGRVVCEARNVQVHIPKYGQPIIFEEGARERRLNGFVFADGNKTSAFYEGTAEQTKFKAGRTRPASVSQVQEYLNLKYEYENRN